MAMEEIIPMGRSRDGFLHSSADVATASKPMYEKNTIDAPLNTPRIPKGVKGERLSGLACGAAVTTKATIAAKATRISAKFNLALCLVPRMSTAQSKRMIMMDGRLTIPPSAGVLSR